MSDTVKIEGPVACAACVVTFNSAETIGNLLRSIAAEELVVRVRIYDNASSDDTVRIVRDLQAELNIDITLDASDSNAGFPIACNELLSRCSEPTVVVVNPDIEFTPGSLERLVDVVTEDQSVGIATCRLMTREGRPQAGAARRRPRLHHLITNNKIGRRAAEVTRSGRDPLFVDRDVECTAGALMVLRVGIIDEVGYLDESVFMYLEDIDFSARVGLAGYSVRYVGTTWVWHDGGASTPTPHEPRIYRLLPQVWVTYMIRYGSPGERMAVRPFIFAFAFGHALLRIFALESASGQLAAMRGAMLYRPCKEAIWRAPPRVTAGEPVDVRPSSSL